MSYRRLSVNPRARVLSIRASRVVGRCRVARALRLPSADLRWPGGPAWHSWVHSGVLRRGLEPANRPSPKRKGRPDGIPTPRSRRHDAGSVVVWRPLVAACSNHATRVSVGTANRSERGRGSDPVWTVAAFWTRVPFSSSTPGFRLWVRAPPAGIQRVKPGDRAADGQAWRATDRWAARRRPRAVSVRLGSRHPSLASRAESRLSARYPCQSVAAVH